MFLRGQLFHRLKLSRRAGFPRTALLHSHGLFCPRSCVTFARTYLFRTNIGDNQNFPCIRLELRNYKSKFSTTPHQRAVQLVEDHGATLRTAAQACHLSKSAVGRALSARKGNRTPGVEGPTSSTIGSWKNFLRRSRKDGITFIPYLESFQGRRRPTTLGTRRKNPTHTPKPKIF